MIWHENLIKRGNKFLTPVTKVFSREIHLVYLSYIDINGIKVI